MLAYVARRIVILVVHTHIVVLHFRLPIDFSVCPKDEKLKKVVLSPLNHMEI